MDIRERITAILSEYQHSLTEINTMEIYLLAEKILEAKRVFIVGAGRTRCVTEMFAMRLAQASITTYMVGEVTTPAITIDDLLVCASGSGKTRSVLTLTERAKETGASIWVITSDSESPIAKLADSTLLLPEKPVGSTQLLGNFTETCLLLILDQVVESILEQSELAPADLQKTHANIE